MSRPGVLRRARGRQRSIWVRPGGWTRRVRVLAALFAVFWGYVFFGLIDLVVPLLDPEFHDVLVLRLAGVSCSSCSSQRR